MRKKLAAFKEQQRQSVRFAFRYGHKLVKANGGFCVFCDEPTDQWLDVFTVTAEVCPKCEAVERSKAEELQAKLLKEYLSMKGGQIC